MDYLTTLQDKYDCRGRVIVFGVMVLLAVLIALGVSIKHLYHYKRAYEVRLEMDKDYEVCCAKYKCTANYWKNKLK